MTNSHSVSRRQFALIALVVFALTALSTTALYAVNRNNTPTTCAAPALPGTTISVTLIDMNRFGMNTMMRSNGVYGRYSMMQINADPSVVPSGPVSFVATNTGYMNHELVILPLAAGSVPGQRAIGSDDKVNEAGSIGEASKTCGEGAGSDIRAGGTGWVAVNLMPGNYELICNLPGHYAAGMFTELQVN